MCGIFLYATHYTLHARIYMSVIKHSDQRVAIFIDTQNLYHSAKNLYNTKVNFGAIMETVTGKRKLIRALAYVITTEAGDETQFFEALTKLGIETKTKDLQIFYGGAKKADWDVGLAVDAIRLAPKVDTIVLATGDGDFVPLVIFLKEHFGVQVEVISFGRSSSTKLREACEDFIDMCDQPEKYLMGYRVRKGSGQGGAKKTKTHSSAKKIVRKELRDEDLGIFAGEKEVAE
jgi:uncharacterized LabA/DUF88 family protein